MQKMHSDIYNDKKGHFASQLSKYFIARALTSLRGVKCIWFIISTWEYYIMSMNQKIENPFFKKKNVGFCLTTKEYGRWLKGQKLLLIQYNLFSYTEIGLLYIITRPNVRKQGFVYHFWTWK